MCSRETENHQNISRPRPDRSLPSGAPLTTKTSPGRTGCTTEPVRYSPDPPVGHRMHRFWPRFFHSSPPFRWSNRSAKWLVPNISTLLPLPPWLALLRPEFDSAFLPLPESHPAALRKGTSLVFCSACFPSSHISAKPN